LHRAATSYQFSTFLDIYQTHVASRTSTYGVLHIKADTIVLNLG
jgi:hypothetical protein